MNEESNGPPPEGSEGNDLEELQKLKRLIVEAQARGEDPAPLVKRAVLATIDVLARRVPRAPDDESE